MGIVTWADALTAIVTAAAAVVAVTTFIVSVHRQNREQASLVHLSVNIALRKVGWSGSLVTIANQRPDPTSSHVVAKLGRPEHFRFDEETGVALALRELREVTVFVRNDSNHVIDRLLVQVVDHYRGTTLLLHQQGPLRAGRGVMIIGYFPPEIPGDAGRVRAVDSVIRFTHGSGRRWRRTGVQPVARTHARAGVMPRTESFVPSSRIVQLH